MFNKNNAILGLLAVFAVLLVLNSLQITGLSTAVNVKIAQAQEGARPAHLEIIKLVSSDCVQCADISPLVDKISSQNVEIKSQKEIDVRSPEGKSLLQKHSIKQLPSLIISGETRKNSKLEKFWENLPAPLTDSNVAVFESSTAPFFDVQKNSAQGLVHVIELTANACSACTPLSSIIDLFKQNGVIISSIEKVDFSEDRARELIESYGIRQAPAVLFSKDIEAYPAILEQLTQLNVQLKNNYYPMHSTMPPFVDTSTGETQGLADLISLVDSSCTECYDVNINKSILRQFGVYLNSDRTVDVSSPEGQVLVQQYSITRVPIILISPSANVYPTLSFAWTDVGSIETNGWFVMRSPEVIGTYKEISTGNVINPQAQAPSE